VSRSVDERIAGVRGVIAAANAVYRDRAAIAADIERSTGLSKEGVELGFECLERDATADDLRALVDRAGDAPRVHVILSANVFVAPLRAIALARAASDHVTVSPSSREPAFARALVAAARDPGIAIVADRDVAIGDADRIDVYGRDETIADVRARARTSAVVRGHGAGLGVAIVTAGDGVRDGVDAADALAGDVVAFDQRGCLSPRVVFVEGTADRASAFASALSERLTAWEKRVPRGSLTDQERADAVRWRDALSFAGRVWIGAEHVVALAPSSTPLAVPPSGRHVLVVCARSLDDVATQIGPISRFVVSVGTNDPDRARSLAPPHARVVALGRMQRPALDGPVDGRASQSGRLL
jgi:hypothetical protein